LEIFISEEKLQIIKKKINKKMPKGTLIVRPKSAQLAHDTEAFGKMVIFSYL
jgi:hypothetical protein